MKKKTMTATVVATERELAAAEPRLATAKTETDAAIARIAADEVAGELTTAEAQNLRRQATETLREEQEAVENLRAALPLLRERAAAEQEAERLRKVEKLRAEVRQALADRAKALRRFDTRTRDAVTAAREVERHRQLVDAGLATLGPLLHDDDELGLDLDESTWPEASDELVAVLQAGPRCPRAERERRAEEAAADAERQANETLDWLRRNASETNLKLLPAHLHERGREVLDAYRIEHEEAQKRQHSVAKSREAERV